VNIVAALAVKELMEREKIPGALMFWPGVAEELVAGKAFMVRDGVFKGVGAVLFTHIGTHLETTWGSLSAPASFRSRTSSAAKVRIPPGPPLARSLGA
jgi:metal-dependent amidase/aminoacylase/carboxypeptidase family protein